MDLVDYRELQNRLTKECPPLPLLCAVQNAEVEAKLKLIIREEYLTRSRAYTIAKIVMASEEVKALIRETVSIANKEIAKVSTMGMSHAMDDASLLLQAGIALLEN